MKGSEIIVDILITSGVKDIFGYPGGNVLDIYEALRTRKAEITHYLTNGEQGAVFCADGYARVSRDLGVVLTTSGPGATNIVTGVADAFMDSVPLLAITGNVPTTILGTDSFQEVDIVGVTMPITKYNIIVKNPCDLAQNLIDAIHIAKSGRKGSVLIDVPQDIQRAEIDLSHQEIVDMMSKRRIMKNSSLSNTELMRAIELINNSAKVCILCGGGVMSNNDSLDMLEKFGNILNVPIVTSLMGVSCYSSKSRQYFGLAGTHGNPTANHIIKSSDVIIAMGARFGDRMTNKPILSAKQIIQIDIDKAENNKNIDSICFLNGDIGEVLGQLIPHIKRKSEDYIQQFVRYRTKHGIGDNDRQIHNLLEYLSKYIGDDGLVATDVGNHQMAVAKNYKFGRHFLTSGGLGAMGFGLPSLIGGVLASKFSRALLVTGDGSFNMDCCELHTAVRLGLPIVIIILNNQALGMCKCQQESNYGGEYMTCYVTNIDYKLLANSYGAYGYSIDSLYNLKKILNEYQFDKPIVIDFRLNRGE